VTHAGNGGTNAKEEVGDAKANSKHNQHARMQTDEIGGFIGFDEKGQLQATGKQPTLQDKMDILQRANQVLRQQEKGEKKKRKIQQKKEKAVHQWEEKCVQKEKTIEHLITKLALTKRAGRGFSIHVETHDKFTAKGGHAAATSTQGDDSSNSSESLLSAQVKELLDNTMNENMQMTSEIASLKSQIQLLRMNLRGSTRNITNAIATNNK
ncbi:hypothetical protein RFI_06504, partial [Reticulomyxa filosa]